MCRNWGGKRARWAFCAGAAALTAVVWADGGGSISGIVRDAATGQGIESASIVLDGGQPIATDQYGRFAITGVKAGPHALKARARNERVGQAAPREESRSVSTDGTSDLTVDFRLPRMASIEGTVLDEERHPLKGQMVLLAARRYEHGEIAFTNIYSVVTNAEGRYRFDGAPAGEPLLVMTGRVTQTPEQVGDGKPVAVDTYYPHSASVDDAEEITLAPDEARTRMDIRQVRAPAYCVSGAIRGARLSAAVVVTAPGPVATPFATAAARPADSFRVCGLPRGEYLFDFVSFADDHARLEAVQAVSVTRRDIGGVNVTLLPEHTIQPRFVWDKADSAQMPPAQATIEAIDRRSTGSLFQIHGQTSGSLPPLPESFFDYSLRAVIRAPGVYAKDILYGGASVSRSWVHPSGSDLTIVLARDGATLSATATADDKPQADASIAIMPVSSQSEAEFAGEVKFGRTDQSGVWTSPLLAPGKYLAIAADEKLDTTVFHIDRLWAARAKAKAVELGPNEILRLRLAVEHLGSN
jgi:hypothetical protein